MYFCSFSSDSSGNSYLIKNEHTALILDCGISCKRIVEGLKINDVLPEEIDGVFLTHEHIDHVKSVSTFSKKLEDAKVYLSEGTKDAIDTSKFCGRCQTVKAGEELEIGGIKVRTFNLSHDAAEPIGYSFQDKSGKLAVVTDTGVITEEIFEEIKDCDMLVMEANHEVNILRMGDYPYPVKQRILGDEGHLSNETAGKFIAKFVKGRDSANMPKVLLAHMSQRNNTPIQAFLTIRNILEEEGLYLDKDLQMQVLYKDKVSPRFEV